MYGLFTFLDCIVDNGDFFELLVDLAFSICNSFQLKLLLYQQLKLVFAFLGLNLNLGLIFGLFGDFKFAFQFQNLEFLLLLILLRSVYQLF